jgi:hypothetical protein
MEQTTVPQRFLDRYGASPSAIIHFYVFDFLSFDLHLWLSSKRSRRFSDWWC